MFEAQFCCPSRLISDQGAWGLSIYIPAPLHGLYANIVGDDDRQSSGDGLQTPTHVYDSHSAKSY